MRSNATLLLVALLGAAALAGGCAHQFTYLPVGPGTSGAPAAQYPVPPEAPQGEVYVTSFGFTDFDNGQGGGQRLLHARVAVSNGSAATWEVDGRQQFIAAPGQSPQPPSFVNTNAGSEGPVYPIGPGVASVFDLYFALPPGLNQPEALSGFALDWSVNAAGNVVTNQTPFGRFDSAPPSYDPYPPYVVVGLGFGVGWWYSPFYPYRHYPPVIRGYYYAPRRTWGGPYRGPPPGAWHGAPPRAGTWHGRPPGGAWHGAPPRGGAWHGTPPAMPRSTSPAPVRAAPHGGGWHGGGGHRH
jgi:hypothetical protein